MKKIKIYKASETDWRTIEEIMRKVIDSIDDKDSFFTGHWEEIFQLVRERGLSYIADCGNVAAGFLLVHIPCHDEDNLGYDIGLKEEELRGVAHMEVAAVLPEFRGNSIQRLLLEEAEPDLYTKGYKYLMATVYPRNAASLNSFLNAGYQIVMTKMKYGGLERHILLKELSRET